MRPILLLLVALAATSQPITEIQLRRTACYGVCPDDELTIRTDGTASYSGMQSARRGDWRGKIARADARRLAQTIESIGFEKLEASYGQPNGDARETKEVRRQSHAAGAAGRGDHHRNS
jgi:hypothetical protein